MKVLAHELVATGRKSDGVELISLTEGMDEVEDHKDQLCEEVCLLLAKGFRSQRLAVRKECKNAMSTVMARLEQSRYDNVQNALICMVNDEFFAWTRLIALELIEYDRERGPKAELRLLEDEKAELSLKLAAMNSLYIYAQDPGSATEIRTIALKYVQPMEDPSMRLAAANVLRHSYSYEGRDAMLELLQDSERSTSELLKTAVRGLSELDRKPEDESEWKAHNAKMVGAMAPMLQHGDVEVREEAADALQNFRDPNDLAVAALSYRPLWPERNPKVLEAIRDSLYALQD